MQWPDRKIWINLDESQTLLIVRLEINNDRALTKRKHIWSIQIFGLFHVNDWLNKINDVKSQVKSLLQKYRLCEIGIPP